MNENELKIYSVDFDGVYPVGSCLIIAANDFLEAESIARKTITHTNIFTVNEVEIKQPCVITYLSGDY